VIKIRGAKKSGGDFQREQGKVTLPASVSCTPKGFPKGIPKKPKNQKTKKIKKPKKRKNPKKTKKTKNPKT